MEKIWRRQELVIQNFHQTFEKLMESKKSKSERRYQKFDDIES